MFSGSGTSMRGRSSQWMLGLHSFADPGGGSRFRDTVSHSNISVVRGSGLQALFLGPWETLCRWWLEGASSKEFHEMERASDICVYGDLGLLKLRQWFWVATGCLLVSNGFGLQKSLLYLLCFTILSVAQQEWYFTLCAQSHTILISFPS